MRREMEVIDRRFEDTQQAIINCVEVDMSVTSDFHEIAIKVLVELRILMLWVLWKDIFAQTTNSIYTYWLIEVLFYSVNIIENGMSYDKLKRVLKSTIREERHLIQFSSK